MADVIPRKTSNSIPSLFKFLLSSPRLPKTYGSPPLSLVTIFSFLGLPVINGLPNVKFLNFDL